MARKLFQGTLVNARTLDFATGIKLYALEQIKISKIKINSFLHSSKILKKKKFIYMPDKIFLVISRNHVDHLRMYFKEKEM